jgi:NAD(P)-dependent dehydrogenase (short-subunit alcohol dehydrogenase family)
MHQIGRRGRGPLGTRRCACEQRSRLGASCDDVARRFRRNARRSTGDRCCGPTRRALLSHIQTVPSDHAKARVGPYRQRVVDCRGRRHAGIGWYSAAKSALHGLTRTLAKEIGPAGVLVNVVMPGATATEGVKRDLDKGCWPAGCGPLPTRRLPDRTTSPF